MKDHFRALSTFNTVLQSFYEDMYKDILPDFLQMLFIIDAFDPLSKYDVIKDVVSPVLLCFLSSATHLFLLSDVEMGVLIISGRN